LLGDGTTDDTAAINAAMSDGNRCGQGCLGSTTTPAVVYFPAGTYLVTSPIYIPYYTQTIGDPTNMPTIKASAAFTTGYVIDADPYYTSTLNWGSTTVFFRQIRNLRIDMTSIPLSAAVSGIHWPTAQATSLQNIVFDMSTASGVQTQGLFIEEGSAGYAGDLVFNGGIVGAAIGNQQYTMRNLTFNNCVTAIYMFWDWGWTYKNLNINNCQQGIYMAAGGSSAQAVGSITVLDSAFTNVPVGIITAHSTSSSPATAGSIILENLDYSNVPIVVQNDGSTTALAGGTGTGTIAAWGQGHRYVPSGPDNFIASISANSRPSSLLSGDTYYERSKPQYETLTASSFSSVRDGGAAGDGTTDDTAAIQSVLNSAASAGKVVFFDAGTYKVTDTITIPAGSKIVGETYSVIMSSGSAFNDKSNPKVVVKVGSNSGDSGTVEWSDMIVSTQGQQQGAILIEWNLASGSGSPSGMWDVHTRVGGFAGSNLQVAQCEKTPDSSAVIEQCISAYMLMHVTSGASGLYMENCWLWVADHDIDGSNVQIDIYSGRGLLIESTAGNIWLYGTAVEHNQLYQYNLVNTKNIVMGQVQTETAYYQPNPNVQSPFDQVASLNDPDFDTFCANHDGNCDGWGLRIVDSSDILVYGAGLYSFFNNWDTTCSDSGGPENCQSNIFDLEGTVTGVSVYNLNTIGSVNMITQDGTSLASYSDNIQTFPQCIALFRPS
jgi:glucan 1,3-beta-glucosidase